MSAAMTAEAILDIFNMMGLRSTRPRRLIAQRLAQLAAQGEDFATDDLWRGLLQVDPQLGRATVFRAVDVLAEQGVLDRVTFADGTHRYRVCGPTRHHHHVTCSVCHRVVEIDACLAPELLAAIERSTDFALEGHSVELFGRCADCRVGQANRETPRSPRI
jgi:Fur family transcriptional regulator, ferric uptake regulator